MSKLLNDINDKLAKNLLRVRKMFNDDTVIADADLVPLLLLHIAVDTRRMLAIAEENQEYIREMAAHDLGRQTEGERRGRDGEDAPDGGNDETNGEDNDDFEKPRDTEH